MIPESFYEPEIRCGHTVTERTKRIWAVELRLLELFDRFCQVHGLRYFAGYGTLLGAVRHRGFVPWDDDIDVVMLRPEYERMKRLAADYFFPPFSFQASSGSDSLQLITPFAKLRDDRTAAVEFPSAPPEMSQGIFIDIFPLDSLEDDTPDGMMQWRTKLELYTALSDPEGFCRKACAGKMVFDADTAYQLTQLTDAERMIIFEDHCLQTFDATDRVMFIGNAVPKGNRGYPKTRFNEVVYLPFEYMQVPVPAQYEAHLSEVFGSYMIFVKGVSRHADTISVMDPDKSYREYLTKP